MSVEIRKYRALGGRVVVELYHAGVMRVQSGFGLQSEEERERCVAVIHEAAPALTKESIDAELRGIDPSNLELIDDDGRVWRRPDPLPDPLPSVSRFSSDLLPQSIVAAVDDIAVRMQCPPDFPAALRGPDPIGRLWVVEGPTDTAAMLSAGLDVVGVPSAGGAADLLDGLARRLRPQEVAIVADADQAGRRGAERLRDALLLVAPVRIVSPPEGIKDARAWVCSGADRASIERVADAAPVHRVELHGGSS